MPRSTIVRTGLVALALAASACGDSRLGDLSEGISRDSVAVIMGTDAPDHQQSYLSRGIFWEVLYYAVPGEVADTTALGTMSPVVLADGRVRGWGWGYLEELSAEQGFQISK